MHHHTTQPIDADLHVVSVISNPKRFRSRYKLYHDFAKRVTDAGAKLLTVELAYANRPFEITHECNAWNLRVRTEFELWHKENLINLGVNYLNALCPHWKYVAWVDADVTFARPDWVRETLHQLQHYHVVQMFSHAHDLGPDETVFDSYNGFVWSYFNKQDELWKCGNDAEPYPHFGWHPGYAWAWRREAWDAVGGMIDVAILGSADQHMARALIGRGRESINPGMHPNYLAAVDRWQEHAERNIRRNVGYVPGSLFHHWHGRKSDRGYLDRWKILLEHQYDPHIDLKRDSQGVYQLNDRGDLRSIVLRDKLRRYFSSRNEDAIDMEVKR